MVSTQVLHVNIPTPQGHLEGILKPEEEEILPGGGTIGAQAFENARATEHGVAVDVDPAVRPGGEGTIHPGVSGGHRKDYASPDARSSPEAIQPRGSPWTTILSMIAVCSSRG